MTSEFGGQGAVGPSTTIHVVVLGRYGKSAEKIPTSLMDSAAGIGHLPGHTEEQAFSLWNKFLL